MSKVVALLGLVLLLVGCQPTSSISTLPAPSYTVQTVTPPRAPAYPSPVATNRPAIAATPPKQAAAPASNAPAGWVPSAPARPWKWIVIHHSATPTGGARAFDKMHRDKGWDELGYHFVIGNGTNTGNGQIEVGSRWPKQKYGAHTKTPDNQYNDTGIGICLVGNFDVSRPTAQQLQSLAKLVSFLEKRYNIPPNRVIGHRDAKPTDCPGRNVNIQVVRRMASQMLADSNVKFSDEEVAAMIDEANLAQANGNTDGAFTAEDLSQMITEASAEPAAGTELLTDTPAAGK